MKLIKNSFFVFLSFILVISGIFITDIKFNSNKVHAETEDLTSESWETSESLLSDTSDKSDEISSRSSKSYVITSAGVKYDSKKKKWIAFHKINKVVGKPTTVKTTLKILKKPSKGSKATTYHTRSHTFKGKSLKSGAIYEYEIPNTTGFYKKEFAVAMTSGGKIVSTIVPDSKYILFNKKLVQFPDYTDKGSKKIASDIRTDWPKGAKYKRAATDDVRRAYEKKYKVYPNWKKDKIELHHIKPVAYGGNSKIENYQAIPKDKHAKITSWFASY